MNKVKITETLLRDAHQSLAATRMTTDDMIPALEKLDQVGYYSLEAWGGATFDSCLRYLNEDPWERLRIIKKHVKNTKLQMLLRGQNLLGYKHYADDVVEYFVKKSIENGIDIIRIFDALNDLRNVECAIKACKAEGGHAQGAISYTLSPVHTLKQYTEDAKRLVDMGSDSICIKDMAGLIGPFEAYDLIKAIKEVVKVPIQLHTHYTSGLASMAYIKAIEAGVDAIDCALSPLALGTSQPATETLVAALKGTRFDTGLDLNLLSEIASHFMPIREKFIASGMLDSKMLCVDVDALKYQVPGGMLSNLIYQLKQANAEDKFEEVLKEIPRIREDFGYPPLVTPTSQIVGTQAVMNVLSGERYKMVPKESKAVVKGEYGKTPAEIKPQIIKKILGDEKQITCRPADLIKPELNELKEKIKEYARSDEDVLSYALLPQVAENYFKARKAAEEIKVTDNNDSNDVNIAVAISAAVSCIAEAEGTKLIVRSFNRSSGEPVSAWNTASKLNMR